MSIVHNTLPLSKVLQNIEMSYFNLSLISISLANKNLINLSFYKCKNSL